MKPDKKMLLDLLDGKVVPNFHIHVNEKIEVPKTKKKKKKSDLSYNSVSNFEADFVENNENVEVEDFVVDEIYKVHLKQIFPVMFFAAKYKMVNCDIEMLEEFEKI